MDLFYLFELHHLFILVLGLTLGIVVGALPGLTPTMGVALTIPFTFSLGATEGLVIIGGIYCGSVFGGSIPAILFNVPGAPANVATTFDGYAMTKKGEANKALQLATISSFVGGLFGMILLLYFSPVFSNFSLQFGPAQTFWIALFGITVIAAISEGSVQKNLIGGCIGILLSFIGISTITGTARFTFGFDSFIGGLHIVAVLIGLFAFPQALRMIEDLTSDNSTTNRKYEQTKSSIKHSILDVVKRPRALLTGTSLGAFIGMIPGAGGNIASILAYNETKRFSKEKGNYGKGEKNGIIASEAANNAMVGGSLIPLLTLGIPGSPTAAIFLGGLLIHGIWPGANLFVDNANVAYTFLYSMVFAQVMLLFLGLFMIKHMSRLSTIPNYIMAPIILSFSIIGAYTTQNNVFDIYTVSVIGLLMFFLQKGGFSPAPIALGFILGSIAEENFLQASQIGGANGAPIAYFFSGGWNIVLFSLVMLTIFFSYLQNRMKKNKDKALYAEKRREFTWKSLFNVETVGWLLSIAFILCSIFFIADMRFELKIFPLLTLISLFVLSLGQLINVLLKRTEKKDSIRHQWIFFKENLSIYIFLVIVSMLTVFTTFIGYYAQVFLLMMVIPYYAYRKKKKLKISYMFLIAAVFTFTLYIVFTVLLKVSLPNLMLFL